VDAGNIPDQQRNARGIAHLLGGSSRNSLTRKNIWLRHLSSFYRAVISDVPKLLRNGAHTRDVGELVLRIAETALVSPAASQRGRAFFVRCGGRVARRATYKFFLDAVAPPRSQISIER